MKIWKKKAKPCNRVTILGTAILAGLLAAHCGSGAKRVPLEDRPPPPPSAAEEAAAVEVAFQEAVSLYRAGDVQRGTALFEEVLEANPDHAEARRYLECASRKVFCTLYPGDSLSHVAGYYYGDVEKWPVIARANDIEDPKKAEAYRRLRVPWFPDCAEGKDEADRLRSAFFRGRPPEKILVYPVKEGDNLGALSVRHYHDERLRFMLADYNALEDPDAVPRGLALRIPIFPLDKRQPDRKALDRALAAIGSKEYDKALGLLESIPPSVPFRAEVDAALRQVRREGVSHYEVLGDRALEASETAEACAFWRKALEIDPGNPEVRRKLQEAEHLLRALKMLPDL